MNLDGIESVSLLLQRRSHRSSSVYAMLLLLFLFMMSIAMMFLTCLKVLAFLGLSPMAYLSYLYLSLALSLSHRVFVFAGQTIERTKKTVIRHFRVFFQDRALSRQLHQEEDQTKDQ